MAPVIWGLNLGEIQWSKFKSSYMWNNRYHLRRTKFIVYQMAMIFCVVSESLGTDALSSAYNRASYASFQLQMLTYVRLQRPAERLATPIRRGELY